MKPIFKISSNKWYGRFWPPERKKIKLMQALVDYQTPKLEKKLRKAVKDNLLYGKPLPTYKDWNKK